MNFAAVTLDVSDAVRILRFCSPQVHNTVNWQRSCTFSTVESEIPAFAAPGTASDSKSTSPVNMEGCVREVLGEHTVLNKRKEIREIDNSFQMKLFSSSIRDSCHM